MLMEQLEQLEVEPDIVNIACNNIEQLNMTINQTKNENVLITCLNARSCASLTAFDEIKLFIFDCKRETDVLIICETWFQSNQCAIYEIRGYTAIHDCRENRRGGGLSIYVSDKWAIKCKEIGIIGSCNSIRLKIVGQNKAIYHTIIGVYRPPTHDNQHFDNFIQSFEPVLETASTENCIIAGDFNIDMDKQNVRTRRYSSLAESYGFKICNKFPTRLQSNTRIDHVLSNTSLEKKHHIITTSCEFSDHEVILTSIESVQRGTHKPFTRKLTDFSMMRTQLAATLHERWPASEDVNAMYDCLESAIKECHNNSTTLRTVTSRRAQKDMCPWLVNRPAIQLLTTEKRNVWKRYNRTGRTNANLLAKLKRLTNTIGAAKASAKYTYFHERFTACVNPKQTWDRIKEVLRTKKPVETITEIKTAEGIIEDKQATANVAATHFAQIGDCLANKIRVHEDDHPNKMDTIMRNTDSIFLYPTTQDEVTKLIHNLDTKKATGLDGISAAAVQKCATVIAPTLSRIINNCFVTGQYPEKLKMARVVAIYKDGAKDDINNYRPISILPALNKVVERCVYNRLCAFLNKKKFFLQNQHGFRTGYSTRTATSAIVNRTLIELDKGRAASAIFLDLSKAFDSVPHESLLTKLDYAGVRGPALALMRSYLSIRKIRVDIEGTLSDEREVPIGVGQGSILGPLLYLVYINDIGRLPIHGTLSMYADDTAVFYFNDTNEQNKIDMIHDIGLLREFYRLNRLTLNLGKTQFTHFERSRHNRDPDTIIFGEAAITEAPTVKYLGLTMDKHLNWKAHIEGIIKKIAGTIGIITKLSHFMPTTILLIIYNSLVHSNLSYLTVLWAAARQTHRRPLQRLQNRVLKRCLKLPNMHNTKEVYQSSNVLPVRGIGEMQLSEYVWQQLSSPPEQPDFVFPPCRLRRGNPKLAIPRISGYHGQSSLSFRGSKLYNTMPANVVESRTKIKLKNETKKWLISNENIERLIY